MEYTARMNEHALVSRAAAAGSCVLLKNVENTLPFAGTKDEPVRVAVFGIGQIFTPTGLTGMEPWRKIGILDGLTAEPTVKPDALLAHKYRAWALEHPEGSEMPLGSLSMEEFASMNDAAMIVLARSAAHYDPKLTSFEQDMFKKVTGAFSRVVLDLGCGKGEYTVALAADDPARNYIGVDIKGARMWRGAKTATEQGMDNVGFLRTRTPYS